MNAEILEDCFKLIGHVDLKSGDIQSILNDPVYLDINMIDHIYKVEPPKFVNQKYYQLRKQLFDKYHVVYENAIDYITNNEEYITSNDDERAYLLRSNTHLFRLQRGLIDLINFFYNENCVKSVVMHGNVIEQHGVHTPTERPYVLIFLSEYYRKQLNDDFVFSVTENEKMVTINLQKTYNIKNTRILRVCDYTSPKHHNNDKTCIVPKINNEHESGKLKIVGRLKNCKRYGHRLGVKHLKK